MLQYHWLFLHIFLTPVTSGWQKSKESSVYGMMVQESRNDSQISLLRLDMYQPFNKHILCLSNNSDKSHYQASKEFVLLLPYK